MEPLTSPRAPCWPLGALERAQSPRSPSPIIPAGAMRGVSPSRFPPLPLGPVVMTSPRSQGQVGQLTSLSQQIVGARAFTVPMGSPPQQLHQCPSAHILQPMLSPRGYPCVAPVPGGSCCLAPAAAQTPMTLPPTPEALPRHRVVQVVQAPQSPRSPQTRSAQNLAVEPVVSPRCHHRMLGIHSNGSVPLIQSIYSPLRGRPDQVVLPPAIPAQQSLAASQESLAQQLKALQAARASYANVHAQHAQPQPFNLREALKRWPCPPSPDEEDRCRPQDDLAMSEPPEADAMSVFAEPDEPEAPEEAEATPAPEVKSEEAELLSGTSFVHERVVKARSVPVSSTKSHTTTGSSQLRRQSLMPEVQEEAQRCRAQLQKAAAEISSKDLRELRQLVRPPRQVKLVLDTISLLLGEKPGNKGYNWKKVLSDSLPQKLEEFEPQSMSSLQRSKVLEAFGEDLSQEIIAKSHQPSIGLSKWCECINSFVVNSNRIMSVGKSVPTSQETHHVLPGDAPATAATASQTRGERKKTPTAPVNGGGKDGKGKGRDVEPRFIVEPDLSSLSCSELTQVSELKVTKPGVGTVVFHGVTDCTDLDVARDIVLKRGFVLVYPDQTKKPPPGQGLNKPASVTMYQCFPPGEPVKALSEDAAQEYRDKIRRMTEENSACTFIDYDCQTGVWKFEVERF